MAESNTDLGFNVNQSLSITYRKVVPWGSSKAMTYDVNQKMAAGMRYQSSMNAVAERNEDYVEPEETVEPMTPTNASNGEGLGAEPLTEQGNGSAAGLNAMRQSLEDAIFNDYIEGLRARDNDMLDESSVEGIRATLKNSSFDDLMDTVNALRQACRKDGVLMLDGEGNPMMGC